MRGKGGLRQQKRSLHDRRSWKRRDKEKKKAMESEDSGEEREKEQKVDKQTEMEEKEEDSKEEEGVRMKRACLVKWSTTPKIAVKPLESGSCLIKSIEIDF
jgi:hypothetical protein